MRSSTEHPIDGSIVDVHDLPWAQLMHLPGDALGLAVQDRRTTADSSGDGARDTLAERVSAFNNYI